VHIIIQHGIFTLYSEGFLDAESGNPDSGANFFISVNSLIARQVLDPSYQSIQDYVNKGKNSSLIGPLDLAIELENNTKSCLALLPSIPFKPQSTLECELLDIQTWCYLSSYFASKLRGATSLAMYRKGGNKNDQTNAINYLKQAQSTWQTIVTITRSHLLDDILMSPFEEVGKNYSWYNLQPMVDRDVSIAING